MKKRPLCMVSLALFVMIALVAAVGKEAVLKKLRPSPLSAIVHEKAHVTVEGRIYKREQKETYQVLYLKQNSILFQGNIYQESNLMLYDSQFTTCNIGSVLHLSGSVGLFSRAANPGNFDQQNYYAKKGIRFRIWAEEIKVVKEASFLLPEYLQRLREKMSRVYQKALGEDGGMVTAMLLGDQSTLEEDTKELYQRNGIGHIIAVSGLHITFLGIGCFKALRKSGCSYFLSTMTGAIVLTLYVCMVGFNVSAIRAWLMFLIRMGAEWKGRIYDMETALCLTACCMSIYNPCYVLDTGFWLSFGALAGILFVAPSIRKYVRAKTGSVTDTVCVAVGMNLVMVPIVLYAFYELPLYGILINLLVVPFAVWIMGGAIAAGVLVLCIPWIGELLFVWIKWMVMLYEGLCRIGIELPFARIILGRPKWWQMLGYYVALGGILWLLNRRERQKQKVWKLTILLLVMGVGIHPFLREFKNRGIQIVMLDVGQGDGIFLRTKSGNTMLIDGGSSDVKSVGKYRIEPFLTSQGIGVLDYVFVTHGDLDHMNGVKEMLQRKKVGVHIRNLILPVKAVWDEELQELAEMARREGSKVWELYPGEKLSVDSMELVCLFPEADTSVKPGNASSLTLGLTYGDFRMLFTGDLEGEGEEAVGKRLLGTYDVLKVAHHGSKNSTSDVFLEKIKPKYALISAGDGNRYGHPHEETVNRLKKAGAVPIITAGKGAIYIETNGEKEKIFFSD